MSIILRFIMSIALSFLLVSEVNSMENPLLHFPQTSIPMNFHINGIRNESAIILADMATSMYMQGKLSPRLSSKQRHSFTCMLENVYMESRGEDLDGKLMVASVVINRVHNSRYPNSICNVIHQPHQFSWTHNSKVINHFHKISAVRFKVKDEELQESVWVAFYTVLFHGNLNTVATCYYAPGALKSQPSWANGRELKFIGKHGGHVFYALTKN